MRFLWTSIAMLALLAGSVLQARADSTASHAAVVRVAETVRANYWDTEAGERIAASLHRRAALGEFDGHTHPAELASALSAALSGHDRHFRVTWTPPGDAVPRDRHRVPLDTASRTQRERRSGYGLRRVERVPGNIGVLELTHFSGTPGEGPDGPARRQIDAALDVLAGVDALIIDLRGNSGGSPAMVGYLASAFLPPGVDAYNRFRHRDGSTSEAPTEPHPRPDPHVLIFALVGPRTASAAEAFAYTLQQAGRAQIVGATSAGAANPGTTFELEDGLNVFVSTGSPLNPLSGENWEGRGVQPDRSTTVDTAESTAYRMALEAGAAHLAGPAAEEIRWLLDALEPAAGIHIDAALAGRYGDAELLQRADGLWLRQGRRPERHLQPLSAELFAFADDPTRRLRIHRTGGAIVALELLDPWDPPQRFRRDPSPVSTEHSL